MCQNLDFEILCLLIYITHRLPFQKPFTKLKSGQYNQIYSWLQDHGSPANPFLEAIELTVSSLVHARIY